MSEYDNFAENANTFRAWIDFGRQRPEQIRRRSGQLAQELEPAKDRLKEEIHKISRTAEGTAAIRTDSSPKAVSRPRMMEKGKKVNPGFRF